MQQQLFKTMHPKPEIVKTRHAAGLVEGSSNNNAAQHNFQNAFQFSQEVAQSIQAKLPKGFFLIADNPHDLQKIREEYKNSIHKVSSSHSKLEIIKEKKQSKKIQVREKHHNNTTIKKQKPKEVTKQPQIDKHQKSKKELTFKKKGSTKNHELKDLSEDQFQDESFQSQQFLVNQNKQNKKIVEKKKQSQKQKQRLKQKEKEKEVKQKQKQKQKEKQVKEVKKIKQIPKQIPKQQAIAKQKIPVVQNLYTQQMYLNPPMPMNIPFAHQQFYDYYFIHKLSSGQPRYNPATAEIAPTGTQDINNLRYLFGLPYGLPMTESIPKLNEKQKNFCYNILHKLKMHRSSQAFKIPVDPLGQGVPDYHQAVYNPMDLQTIFKRVKADKYSTISQFHGDVNRIFLNSYKYNLRQTIYFQSAIQFQDYYQYLLKEAQEKPQQYAKQLVIKITKPKKIDDVGQLDYTQNTPLKFKKKKQGNKISNLSKSQILDKKKNNKLFINEFGTYQSVVSEAHNEFVPENANSSENVFSRKFKLKKGKTLGGWQEDLGEGMSYNNNSMDATNNPINQISINHNDDSLLGDQQYENPFRNSKFNQNKKKKKQIHKQIGKEKEKQKTTTIKKAQSITEEIKKQSKIQIQNKIQSNEKIQKLFQGFDQSFEIKPVVISKQTKEKAQIETKQKSVFQQPQKKKIKQQRQGRKQISKQQRILSKNTKKPKNINDDYNDDDDQCLKQNTQMQAQLQQFPQQMKDDQNIEKMRISMDFNNNDSDEMMNKNMNEIRNEDYLQAYLQNKDDKQEELNQEINQSSEQKMQKLLENKQERIIFEHKIVKQEHPFEYGIKNNNHVEQKQKNASSKHLKNDIIINTTTLAELGQSKKGTMTTRHHQNVSTHQQQNIVVNNLNTHPPLQIGSNIQSFDVVAQQLSSTAHMTLPPLPAKTKSINKSKIKTKNVDEDYKYPSSDEEYVEPKYKKRKQKKKKQNSKDKGKQIMMMRENSNSVDVSSVNFKRRGRQPKKQESQGPHFEQQISRNLKNKYIEGQQANIFQVGQPNNTNNLSLTSIPNQLQASAPSTQPIAQSESPKNSFQNIKPPAPLINPSDIFMEQPQQASAQEDSGINFLQYI